METSFVFTASSGLRSGCHMLHLVCDAGEDWVPFYLLPPKQGPHAPIAFLASTLTYMAYAKHARFSTDAAFRDRVQPDDAARLFTFDDPKSSGLRPSVADTHLLAWLEEKGFTYDIITDEDLDDEGQELLVSTA